MLIKTKAIVLSVIKYNDNDVIVKTFTQHSGFVSYYIKGLLKSKKGKLKKAFFQPNALLQLVATQKNKEQLEYIREANPYYHYKSLYLDFDKLSISTFMREVLLESLKNEQSDEALFNYIETLFIQLDQNKFDPDIHLNFLVKLSQFLGFQPQNNSPKKYFDMESGIFTDKLPAGEFLNFEESNLLKRILGMVFDSNSIQKLSNYDRRKGIEILLKYYQLHIERFKMPKSLKILSQIYQ